MLDTLRGNADSSAVRKVQRQIVLRQLLMSFRFDPLWLVVALKKKKSQSVMEMKHSGFQIYCGHFISLFVSTSVRQKLYVSPALQLNLPIVRNVGLYKQQLCSAFSLYTETLLLAHTCGFHTRVKCFFCVTNDYEQLCSHMRGRIYHQKKKVIYEDNTGVGELIPFGCVGIFRV